MIRKAEITDAKAIAKVQVTHGQQPIGILYLKTI